MAQKRVIIVGAGIAGLAAGYELVKRAGDKVEVVIVEALDRIGGRLDSVDMQGKKIDVGGYMIFPFYKTIRAYLKEFDLKGNLRRLSDSEFYRIGASRAWIADTKVSVFTLAPIRLVSRALLPILRGRVGYYDTDFTLYGDMTARTYLDKIGVSEETKSPYDTILHAYTYASLDKVPAPLFISMGWRLLVHGFFNRCKVLKGGSSVLIQRFAREFSARGGVLRTSSPVESIEEGKVTLENGEVIAADAVIVASPAPVNLVNLDKPLRPDSYTEYDFVVARMSGPVEMGGRKDWFIAYEAPKKAADAEAYFSSFVQLASFSDLSREYVGGYLRWPQDADRGTEEEVRDITVKSFESAFTGLTVEEIPLIHRWRLTMPALDAEMVLFFRASQGKKNIWFAGDYLGFPSMDTAAHTGKEAAKNVLNALGIAG